MFNFNGTLTNSVISFEQPALFDLLALCDWFCLLVKTVVTIFLIPAKI